MNVKCIHSFMQYIIFRLLDYAMVNVRRKLYEPSSPAGKGTKWEWAGPNGSGDWHCYDMQVQCVIEAAWATVITVNQTINIAHSAILQHLKN